MALAKKETGIRPNGLEFTAMREKWRYVPTPGAGYAPSAIRPIAHAQHASSQAVATLALFL